MASFLAIITVSLFFLSLKVKAEGVKLPILHRHSKFSPFANNETWEENLVSKVSHRHKKSRSLMADKISARAYDDGAFVVEVAIGAPPQPVYALLDTGSDLSYVPCKDCNNCSSLTIFNLQMSRSYVRKSCSSSECRQLHSEVNSVGCDEERGNTCKYTMEYADGSWVSGPLSGDMLTLNHEKPFDFVFGCVQSSGAQLGNKDDAQTMGLVGLARGPLSLASQTMDIYNGVFSYCLPRYSIGSPDGYLVLGNTDKTGESIAYTPLLSPPDAEFPNLYYVNMIGITVENVFIPTKHSKTFVDSGTELTYLVKDVFGLFNRAFHKAAVSMGWIRARNPMEGSSSLCYKNSHSNDSGLPNVTLHLDGFDVPLDFSRVLWSPDKSLVCLAFDSVATSDGDKESNVIGIHQLQGFLVVYDIPKSRLGFHEKC